MACLKFSRILRGPPVQHVAIGVETTSLVVEAVHELVTDDGSHATVVDGAVYLEVEVGWPAGYRRGKTISFITGM